jgi:ketosteroid isomerase-like protein
LGTPEENTEVARRWWARFNEEGSPPLDLCDEEIEMWNPDGFLVRGPYHGHEGMRRWREDVFDVFDEARVEVDELIDVGDGEAIVMFLRLRGIASHTRIEVDAPWAAVCRLRGGKLLHAQGYAGKREALEAAGLCE